MATTLPNIQLSFVQYPLNYEFIMTINEKIGHRITTLRVQKDISQKALAFDAEINRTYLSGVEKGVRKISVETLEKITKALNISLMEFFNHNQFLDE